MTPEELEKEITAGLVARGMWAPHEVNPDLLMWRSWSAASCKDPEFRKSIKAGRWDNSPSAQAYLAGAAASAERIKELEAALVKANEPEWFYSAEDSAPEHSVEDAIEANLYDSLPGRYLVEIDTARRCKTIWGIVDVLTKEEIEARGDDEEWVFTPCATEAEARALLEQTNP